MTYAERIERVKAVILDTCRNGGNWDAVARAADRAVLEAIREPTKKMKCMGGEVPVLRGVMAISLDRDEVTSIYQAMHGAIPREE